MSNGVPGATLVCALTAKKSATGAAQEREGEETFPKRPQFRIVPGQARIRELVALRAIGVVLSGGCPGPELLVFSSAEICITVGCYALIAAVSWPTDKLCWWGCGLGAPFQWRAGWIPARMSRQQPPYLEPSHCPSAATVVGLRLGMIEGRQRSNSRSREYQRISACRSQNVWADDRAGSCCGT